MSKLYHITRKATFTSCHRHPIMYATESTASVGEQALHCVIPGVAWYRLCYLIATYRTPKLFTKSEADAFMRRIPKLERMRSDYEIRLVE
jgi:hypothetical protein